MMAAMSVAKTPPEMWPDVWPHEDRPLTVKDMENMPDHGNRYELDEGMLIVSPAPFNNHQIVTDNLYFLLRLARTPGFIVISGPGINFSEFQHRIPDIAVIRAEGFRVAEVFNERPPLLAVEVASRRTRLYDRTRKKEVYEQYGVQSYWIVNPDPERPDVTAFSLIDGKYRESGYAAAEERFSTEVPFPVSFTPAELLLPDPID
jgi:Uma2 family endonuclease